MKIIDNNFLSCMLLLDNSIDKRTISGKRLVNKIKAMDKNKMNEYAKESDMHPALVSLRYKDLMRFFTFDNSTLN